MNRSNQLSKKKPVLASLFLAMTCSFPTLADSVRVENTGAGQTLDHAIDDAIRRSIEQVKGVSMQSERLTASSYERDTKRGTQASTSAQTGQRSSAQGSATYRILSEKCQPNECRVRLAVDVDVPEGFERQQKLKALNKNRRTIAVKPFTGPHAQTLTRHLEAKLVQDRKFKVLQDLSSRNLDYVLQGRVIEAYSKKRVVDNSRTVEMTGEYIKDVKTYYTSKVLVEYKLIDRVNGQVKWSDTVPTTSSRNNLSLLLDISARKVFGQLKENIYPLLALKTKDGQLILNSGGENVKRGQLLDIYVLGERLIDPYTKETLGYQETKVARVRVERVLPKVSYVTLVNGSYDKIRKQAIARHVAVKRSTTKTKPATTPKPVEEKAPARISF